MITCSAPGKVYLFGEHAVVYGEPAIACAINRRVSTSIELVSSGKVRINAMGTRLQCFSEELKYVCCAVQTIKKLFREDFGAEITIRSQLPPRQGLGSSAAVTVSTVKALTECLEIKLENEAIAKIGHQIETAVQGKASAADTFVSSIGGVVFIEQTTTSRLPSFNIPFIIGATGIERSTSDVIASVARMKERYPSLFTNILSAIGHVTRLGKQTLADEDFFSLGELMNVNQGLLESIGVSDNVMSALVYAARTAGALGAKITGAGRGGCVFAIAKDDDVDRVRQAMTKQSAQVLNATLSEVGLQIEDV
jgi:mevalonate kinase